MFVTRHPDSAEHRTMTSICINLHLTHSSFATAPKWLRGHSSVLLYAQAKVWKQYYLENFSNLPFWKYFIKSGSSLCGIASGKCLQTNHISNWLDQHTLDCHNRNLKDRWFWEEVACRALDATPQRKMLILKSGDGTISKAGGRNLKSRRPQSQKQAAAVQTNNFPFSPLWSNLSLWAAYSHNRGDKKPRRRSSCNSTNIATITSSLQQTPQRRADNKR